MDLIDDRGRLFGAVNVIDAFVVLMVVSVLAAGIGFVLSEQNEGASAVSTPTPAQTPVPESEFTTRYATIDFGTQPSYIAKLVSTGDTFTGGNGGELSVTDVYVGPSGGQDAVLVVRAKVRGRVANTTTTGGEQLLFGGSSLRSGETLSLSTGEYAVEGTITSVGRDDPSLDTEETAMLLEATLPTSITERIEPGDAVRVGERTVATVESVRTVPTVDATERRAFLGVTVETIRNSRTRSFGTHPVTLDGTLPLRTPNYSVSGRVLQVGSHSLPGTPARRTVQVEITGMSGAVADTLRSGMRETSGGTVLARVTDERVEPSRVMIERRNGTVAAGRHPTKKDVTLTLSLRVRETDSELLFHGRPLHQGARIVLDFGTIRVRGTVVDLEG